MGEKIDPNLWSDDPQPHLMGGRLPSGEVVFPMPVGDAAKAGQQLLEQVPAAEIVDDQFVFGHSSLL